MPIYTFIHQQLGREKNKKDTHIHTLTTVCVSDTLCLKTLYILPSAAYTALNFAETAQLAPCEDTDEVSDGCGETQPAGSGLDNMR